MTLLTQVLAQGTHAARPAALAANNGYYYFETDTGTLFQSTGAAWVQLAAAVGGGGGGGMAIGGAVTGATATDVLYVGAGPDLAEDAAKFTYAGNGQLTLTDSMHSVTTINGVAVLYAAASTLIAELVQYTGTPAAGYFSDGGREVYLCTPSLAASFTDSTSAVNVCQATLSLQVTGNPAAFQVPIRTDQTAAAATPGTVVAKWPIYDIMGSLVGYLPLYDAIT